MRSFTTFFLLTLAFSFHSRAEIVTGDRDHKIAVLKQTLVIYENEIMARTGFPLQLKFSPSTILQATGGVVDGKPEMTFYEGILTQLSADDLVAITCHELGHILGKVTFRALGVSKPRNQDDSVEGEADYFGGACLLRFFKDPEIAKEVGLRAYESIYRRKINPALAESESYVGINVTYPSDSCRVLSVIRGVEGRERPECWFNPSPERWIEGLN